MKYKTKLLPLFLALLFFSSCMGSNSAVLPSAAAPTQIPSKTETPTGDPSVRYFSVLGDSISTFTGTTPDGYAIYYDAAMQQAYGMQGEEDMWWATVGRALGASLLVNGSWSGSTVSGDFPGACSQGRIEDLATENAEPDCILIYIGVNDCGGGVRLTKNRPEESDSACFASAYRLMLRRLRERYPKAELYCATIMRTALLGDGTWDLTRELGAGNLEDYNREIRDAALEYACVLIDLYGTGRRYETADGLHPTLAGHRELANAWIECLRADL